MYVNMEKKHTTVQCTLYTVKELYFVETQKIVFVLNLVAQGKANEH